jgi:hypothetical protein
MLSLACWGRLLFLEGLWEDDWGLVWHYFATDSFSQFIYMYQSLGHTLDGTVVYCFYNLFEYFKEDATWVLNIVRFILFTLNGLLLYFIFRNLLRNKTILPEIIGAVYIVSPLVNTLMIILIARTLFLTSYFLSVLLTVIILKKDKFNWLYYIFSVILFVFTLLGQESFIFVEIFRSVIIYYIISKKDNYYKFQNILKTTILHWSPYIIIGIGILLYTMLMPRLGMWADSYRPKGMITLSGLILIFNRYFWSIYLLFIGIVKSNLSLTILKGDILTYFLSFFAALLTIRVLFNIEVKDNDKHEILRETKWVMIFGLFLIFASIFPYVATRGIIGGTPVNTRYALEANVGISIFISSFILVLYYKDIITKKLCIVIISVIVLVGVGICNTVVKIHDNDWQQQRSFWWQFIWRAPDLKKGTLLLVDMPRDEYFTGHNWLELELTGPLNMLYADSKGINGIGNHYAMGIDLINLIIEKRDSDVESIDSFNKYDYYPKNLLIASFHDGVLGINGEIDFSNTKSFANIAPFARRSNPDRIIINNDNKTFPLRWIMGLEPDSVEQNFIKQKIRERIFTRKIINKDWRYYYQNAKVAFLKKDFRKVISLYDEAINLDNPYVLPEILEPFIEALYITGDYARGSTLLWKWAVRSNGSHEKALKMRDNISKQGVNTDCVNVLDKDIKEIWNPSKI